MAGTTHDSELELWGGIECTINRVDDQFFDQLQYSGHTIVLQTLIYLRRQAFKRFVTLFFGKSISQRLKPLSIGHIQQKDFLS